MPKSRRDKKVSLTQTKKKGLEAKQTLVQEVRKCVEDYDRIFIFSVCNMRNSKLKEVRNSWKHSRFFYGKNKVMALALGRNAETEVKENLHRLSVKLVNEVGVLFTSKSKEETLDWFEKYSQHDYARAGNMATSTVTLDEGPLVQFSHAIEPHLRKLGMPVALKKGIITVLQDYTVCKEGDTLTPEQARILKLLKVVMSQFTIEMKYCYDKTTGDFESLAEKQRGQVFNKVRVTSDDQEYDFVDANNNEDEEKMEQDENSTPDVATPEFKKDAKEEDMLAVLKSKNTDPKDVIVISDESEDVKDISEEDNKLNDAEEKIDVEERVLSPVEIKRRRSMRIRNKIK